MRVVKVNLRGIVSHPQILSYCHSPQQKPSWVLWTTSCLEPGLRAWCWGTSPTCCPRPSAWSSAAWSLTPRTCKLHHLSQKHIRIEPPISNKKPCAYVTCSNNHDTFKVNWISFSSFLWSSPALLSGALLSFINAQWNILANSLVSECIWKYDNWNPATHKCFCLV